VILKKEPENHS